jgi:hypothetical protein
MVDAEGRGPVTQWLMLILTLPTHPSSMRVRAWRKLRALGAVALKNSVYVLPLGADRLERLQWLTQEVQKDGGDATLLRVDRIENMSESDVIRLFHDARDADYKDLAARYRQALRGLGARGRGKGAARAAEGLARLGRELDRLREIDFFEAPGARELERLRATAEMHLRPAAPPAAADPLPELRGRLWATRPRPHIDRLASAWLIKRYIDPDARFLFAPPAEFPPEAIPFDVLGAELGHQGEDCTFETLLRRGRLADDPRLEMLAEIVHEADLRDGKFERPETDGVDLAVRGFAASIKDDADLLSQGLALFDALHAALAPPARRSRRPATT